MIHDLEHKQNLPPLPHLGPKGTSGKIVAVLKTIGIWLLLAVIALFILVPCMIVALPFLLITGIRDWLKSRSSSAAPGKLTVDNSEDPDPLLPSEERLKRLEQMEIESEEDPETGLFLLRLNTVAFEILLEELEKIYGQGKGPGLGILSGEKHQSGRVPIDSPDYHAHSDFFFPFCPEFTIGTGKGLFKLEGGDVISASTTTWRRALAEWRRIVEEGEPKIIVLDKDQADWCEPDCVGRFCIEFVPDLNKAPEMPPDGWASPKLLRSNGDFTSTHQKSLNSIIAPGQCWQYSADGPTDVDDDEHLRGYIHAPDKDTARGILEQAGYKVYSVKPVKLGHGGGEVDVHGLPGVFIVYRLTTGGRVPDDDRVQYLTDFRDLLEKNLSPEAAANVLVGRYLNPNLQRAVETIYGRLLLGHSLPAAMNLLKLFAPLQIKTLKRGIKDSSPAAAVNEMLLLEYDEGLKQDRRKNALILKAGGALANLAFLVILAAIPLTIFLFIYVIYNVLPTAQP